MYFFNLDYSKSLSFTDDVVIIAVTFAFIFVPGSTKCGVVIYALNHGNGRNTHTTESALPEVSLLSSASPPVHKIMCTGF